MADETGNTDSRGGPIQSSDDRHVLWRGAVGRGWLWWRRELGDWLRRNDRAACYPGGRAAGVERSAIVGDGQRGGCGSGGYGR